MAKDTATPEAAKLSSDFLGNRGRLPWPVATISGERKASVFIDSFAACQSGVK